MKKTLQQIGALLSKTCVLFTVMFVTLFTAGVIAGENGWLFDIGKMYLILLFAFLLSAAGLLFRIAKLPLWRAYVFHFLAAAAAYYCIFILWMGFAGKSGMVLLLLVLFLLLYAVYLALSLSLRRRGARKKAAETPYESAFSKKK